MSDALSTDGAQDYAPASNDAPETLPAEGAITHTVDEEHSPIEQTMEKAYDRANPPRGKGGTFAKLPQANDDMRNYSQDRQPEAAKELAGDQPVERVALDGKAVEYPQSWPAKLRGHWDTLAPEVQQQIAEREQQAHQRITRGGEAEKYIGQLAEACERWAPGIPPEQRPEAVQRLLAAHHALETNPEQAIRWLAQQYGVNVGGHDPAQYEAQQAMLAEQAMHHLYSERSQRLDKLVTKFAGDKLDHWKDLEADIVAHAKVLRDDHDLTDKEKLELAYRRALAGNPAVADRIAGNKRKAHEAQTEAERKRKAAEAKRLASLNVRSVDGKAPKPARKSLEEEMADVYDRVAGR
jgi:hypothetical protein